MSESELVYRVSFVSEFRVMDADGKTIASLLVEPRDGVAHICALEVNVAHRRKGLATRLMNEAVREFGHQPMTLWVHSFHDRPIDDVDLLKFYARFGFERTDYPGGLLRKAVISTLTVSYCGDMKDTTYRYRMVDSSSTYDPNSVGW